MTTSEQLHREVDAEYETLLKQFYKFGPWVALDIITLWRDEKRCVDVLGRRYPKIVNIQIPDNSI